MNHTFRQTGNIVAITPTIDVRPRGNKFRLNSAYLTSLEGAGVVPFIAPPMRDPARAGELLELASGLVLTGGVDIDPAMYGEEAHAKTEAPVQIRDHWEAALADAARAMRLPTLAICRGMQLVNVCMGGTLIQDIPSQHASNISHDVDVRDCRSHEIEIERDTRLAAITGRERIAVNSMHHQGIKYVASPLRVAARASDGMIEALEWPSDDWWMVAVQWHPEELTADSEPWDRKIFRAFAEEALRFRGSLNRSAPVSVS